MPEFVKKVKAFSREIVQALPIESTHSRGYPISSRSRTTPFERLIHPKPGKSASATNHRSRLAKTLG
jgi:hypothetical protein